MDSCCADGQLLRRERGHFVLVYLWRHLLFVSQRSVPPHRGSPPGDCLHALGPGLGTFGVDDFENDRPPDICATSEGSGCRHWNRLSSTLDISRLRRFLVSGHLGGRPLRLQRGIRNRISLCRRSAIRPCQRAPRMGCDAAHSPTRGIARRLKPGAPQPGLSEVERLCPDLADVGRHKLLPRVPLAFHPPFGGTILTAAGRQSCREEAKRNRASVSVVPFRAVCSAIASKPSSLCAIRLERSARSGALWKEVSTMWLAIATLFLIAWVVCFVAFHIAVAAVHILLVLCVIFIIVHFVRKAGRHA